MIGVDGYILKSQAVAALSKYGLSNGGALGHHSGAVECAIAEIEAIPAANAVPVVRCGECVHWKEHPYLGLPDGSGRCKCNNINTNVTFYCGHGDRREDSAAPVVHGRWEINLDGYYPYCSNCKAEPKSGKMTPTCPNCGAKMDLEVDGDG